VGRLRFRSGEEVPVESPADQQFLGDAALELDYAAPDRFGVVPDERLRDPVEQIQPDELRFRRLRLPLRFGQDGDGERSDGDLGGRLCEPEPEGPVVDSFDRLSDPS
jgi:hypothetical protein